MWITLTWAVEPTDEESAVLDVTGRKYAVTRCGGSRRRTDALVLVPSIGACQKPRARSAPSEVVSTWRPLAGSNLVLGFGALPARRWPPRWGPVQSESSNGRPSSSSGSMWVSKVAPTATRNSRNS